MCSMRLTNYTSAYVLGTDSRRKLNEAQVFDNVSPN